MRIALLSNVTVEVLAGMLKKGHDIWTPPGFGGWMETALSPSNDFKAFAPEAIFLLLDSSHGRYDALSVPNAVSALETAFPGTTVVVPDLEDLADEVGSFYDEGMWKLGAMPWSMKGLRAIKTEIERLIGAMKGDRKKVLALDFDNTLWDGVIGEDGVAGIKPFTEFQKEIKALKDRGVLLVALTKNNPADVEPVWEDDRMALKKDDFVDLRIDWNDKADNLVASAKALNLGTDSYVFVDDNPAEREQMKALHPEVAVPDFPISIRRISRLYFPAFRLTDEDKRKTEQYHAEAARRNYGAGLTAEEYLKGLEIWTEIHPIREEEIPRVAQLSQKTNQFNVCTNRYTEADIRRFIQSPDHLIVTLHAGDKFGDQGLVAFVHVCGDEICDWVMSCRAMNRRIEFTVQEWVEKALKERGISKVKAMWRKTLKNAPVKELFEKFGFTKTNETEEIKHYERILV